MSKIKIEAVNRTTDAVTPIAEGHLDLATDHIRKRYQQAVELSKLPNVNNSMPDPIYPAVIAMYNDTTPASASTDDMDGGELIGWATLEHDYYDSKQKLRGTRLLDKYTDEILPDGSRKRRYVVEFSTDQAIGEFNKIRLFGGDLNSIQSANDPKKNIWDYTHLMPYCANTAVTIPNKFMVVEAGSVDTSHNGAMTWYTTIKGDYICWPSGASNNSTNINISKLIEGTPDYQARSKPDAKHTINLPWMVWNSGTNNYDPQFVLHDNGDLTIIYQSRNAADVEVYAFVKYTRASDYLSYTRTDVVQSTLPHHYYTNVWWVLEGDVWYATYPGTIDIDGVDKPHFIFAKMTEHADAEPTFEAEAHPFPRNNTHSTSYQFIHTHYDKVHGYWVFVYTHETIYSSTDGYFTHSAVKSDRTPGIRTDKDNFYLCATTVSEWDTGNTVQDMSNAINMYNPGTSRFTWWSGNPTIGPVNCIDGGIRSFKYVGWNEDRKSFVYVYGNRVVFEPFNFVGGLMKVAESSMPPISHAPEDEMVLRVTYEYIVRYNLVPAPASA